MPRFLTPSSSAIVSPAISASYSASLLVHGSVKDIECRMIPPAGVIHTNPTPALTLGIEVPERNDNRRGRSAQEEVNEVYHGGPEGPAPPSVEHIRES